VNAEQTIAATDTGEGLLVDFFTDRDLRLYVLGWLDPGREAGLRAFLDNNPRIAFLQHLYRMELRLLKELWGSEGRCFLEDWVDGEFVIPPGRA
jgi:hypothetical protein